MFVNTVPKQTLLVMDTCIKIDISHFQPNQMNICQTLICYVEQNPLRAKLVERAEDWKWSSLWRRENGDEKEKKLLAQLPIDLPINYLQSVNEVLKEDNLKSLRNSVNKGTPFGKDSWIEQMIENHNLGHTVRRRGRPRQN
jgi:putative transposase